MCYNVTGDSMTEQELDAIFGTSALFDKDSSEYKEANIYSSIEKEKRKLTLEDPLSVALSQATHLDDNKKERYNYLASLYTADMAKNIFKNQFDLAEKYSNTTVDEWNDFLADRIVSVYIQKHKRTLLKAAAEDNLANPTAKNKRDNLQLIKNLEEQEQLENNRNICIIRIPDIYDDAS